MNRPRIHPRWSMNLHGWKGSRGKVQVESTLRREGREGGLTLPEPVIRLAQEEYDRQFPGQPYERMQQRGGLGLLEMIGFLADRIERVEKLGPWKPVTTENDAQGANTAAQPDTYGPEDSDD